MVLITGPAGSGKTTTAYACIREIIDQATSPKSIVSLEDPIEQQIEGMAQSQINESAHYDWTTGLRAILRQDPEVLMVGEIRDLETALVVFQAALTVNLLLPQCMLVPLQMRCGDYWILEFRPSS